MHATEWSVVKLNMNEELSCLSSYRDTKICVIHIEKTGAYSLNITSDRNIDVIISDRLIMSRIPRHTDFSYPKSSSVVDLSIPLTAGDWFIRLINRVPITGNEAKCSVMIREAPVKRGISDKKYAIILGISDYMYIGDLSYCDEDTLSWYSYLKGSGYEITVLGDKTSNYKPITLDGYGSEKTLREHMQKIAEKIRPGDKFVFISSGHGSGDNRGSSFLCCLDINHSQDGKYMDTELAEDLKSIVSAGTVSNILFFDNCSSGGMLDEAVAVNPNTVCATSTCGFAGYGYDVPAFNHGAWTYHFLERTLKQQNVRTMKDAFERAHKIYPYLGDDTPQIKGNTNLFF